VRYLVVPTRSRRPQTERAAPRPGHADSIPPQPKDIEEVRPHESLDDGTPASVYEPSARPFPSKLLTPEYPAHFEVRKVSTNGGIRWNHAWVNLSHVLGGEYIAFEEIADDIWAVRFGPVPLGWFHVRLGRILDDDGNSTRKPKRRAP